MGKLPLHIPVTLGDGGPTNLSGVNRVIHLGLMPILKEPSVHDLVLQTQYHYQALTVVNDLGFLSGLILYEDFNVVRTALFFCRSKYIAKFSAFTSSLKEVEALLDSGT